MDNLVYMLVVLVVVGLIVYLVNATIPMPPWMRTVINVVVMLFVVLWLLDVMGVVHGFHYRLR
jgi:hypothetical protein